MPKSHVAPPTFRWVEAGGHRVGDGVRPAEPPDERHAGAEEQHDQHDLRVECLSPIEETSQSSVCATPWLVVKITPPDQIPKNSEGSVSASRSRERSPEAAEPGRWRRTSRLPSCAYPRAIRDGRRRRAALDGRSQPSPHAFRGVDTSFVGFVGPIRRFRVLVGRTMVQ